jgi:hypothetical protein
MAVLCGVTLHLLEVTDGVGIPEEGEAAENKNSGINRIPLITSILPVKHGMINLYRIVLIPLPSATLSARRRLPSISYTCISGEFDGSRRDAHPPICITE